MMLPKRLASIFSLFFFLLLPFVLPSPSLAVDTNPLDIIDTVNSGSPTLENWSWTFTDIAITKIADLTFGFSKAEELLAVLRDPTSYDGHRIAWIPGGIMGSANNLIAALHTPAASGIEYIAHIKDNLLGKPAYAQGVGFVGLLPLVGIWRMFRNFVYILSSLVFVIIGIMIILRVKISPQAVITIQNAIPQLVTTLILVTFSYAIAGLLIDLSYFIQGTVIASLFTLEGINFRQNLYSNWATAFNASGFPFFSSIGNLIHRGISSIGTIGDFTFQGLSNPDFRTFNLLMYRAAPGYVSTMMLGSLMGAVITGTFLGGFGNAIGGLAGYEVANLAGNAVGGMVGGIAGLIIPCIISIVIGVWLIKLYFGLVKAYVTIIFKIILAPLEIGLGAFPGSKSGFSTWFWDILSQISIFPIVNLFLIFLNLIIDKILTSNELLWAPETFLVGGESNTLIITAIIGLAGTALVSKLPELIPATIFGLKASPYGTAIGQNIGGATQWIGNRIADLVDDKDGVVHKAVNAPFPGTANVVSGILRNRK